MNLELSKNEKTLLLMALAQCEFVEIQHFQREPAANRDGLIGRIARLGEIQDPMPSGARTVDPYSQPTTSGTILSQPNLGYRDIFTEKPGKCEAIELTISKVEDGKTSKGTRRLKVLFENKGIGFESAAVWDEKLFPYITKNSGWKTFYVARSKDGKYLSIVGVRVPA